jgi:hypothetical protein
MTVQALVARGVAVLDEQRPGGVWAGVGTSQTSARAIGRRPSEAPTEPGARPFTLPEPFTQRQ